MEYLRYIVGSIKTLNVFITRSNLSSAKIYLGLAAIAAILEVGVISLLYGLIKFFMEKKSDQNFLIQFIHHNFNNFDFGNAILIIFVTSFCISLALRSYILRLNLELSYRFGADISKAVYTQTIEKLKRDVRAGIDSSEIITQITSKAYMVVEGLYNPLFTVISTFSVSLLIGIYLLYISFYQTTIVLFVAIVYYFCVAKVFQRIISKNGEKINYLSTQLVDKTRGLLNNRNELLIYSNLTNREADFERIVNELAVFKGRNGYLAQTPKIFLEGIIILSGVLALFVFANNQSIADSGSVIIIFATLRLLPIFQQFYFMFSTVRANQAVVDSVVKTLLHDKVACPREGSYDRTFLEKKDWKTLRFDSVGYEFESGKRLFFDLEIKSRAVNAIVGSSGVGKSTLLDLLSGCCSPSSGNIRLDGKEMVRFSPSWRSSCGFVTQSPSVDLIPEYLVGKGWRRDFDSDLFFENLHVLGLDYTGSQLVNRINGRYAASFSTGEARRLALAFAFAFRDVNIMLLDEVTSGLHVEIRSVVRDFIRTHDVTVVLVTHLSEDLAMAENIIRIGP